MRNEEIDQCEICGKDARHIPTDRDGLAQDCPRCGPFFISGSAIGALRAYRKSKMKVSAWIRARNIEGSSEVTLNADDLQKIANAPVPTLLERAEYTLRYLVRQSPKLGQPVDLLDPAFLAAGHCEDTREAIYLTNFLITSNWIAEDPNTGRYVVTPEGNIKHDEISRKRTGSTQGFIAMRFAPEMDVFYEKGIDVGIRRAGYTPFRLDNHEHANKIDDEIVRQIRRSRFVVADFTGQSEGVYFEAGFALGLDLPVIWTCRDAEVTKLHFDIRQYNCIAWKDEVDLAASLHRRIEALIGRGPNASS